MNLSINGELGYELVLAAPYVYYQHLRGERVNLECAKDASCFYPSATTKEVFQQRTPGLSVLLDGVSLSSFSKPESFHTPKLNTEYWCPPPYSSIYKNDYFRFDKPLMIVSNKYNIEWDRPPINFIDIDTLDAIFSTFSEKYSIVYNRPLSTNITNDNSSILDLQDHAFIKAKHPQVFLMQDLKNDSLSFNELQMSLYANATNFISTQGGNSVIASYFGGTNIIFAREGGELDNNSYKNWFPLLSGAKVIQVNNYADLVNTTKQEFL